MSARTNAEEMFSVRECPWWDMEGASVLDDYVSREEAQKLVHGWEPEEEQLYRLEVEVTDGEPVETYAPISDAKGLYRSDDHTYLGTTSASRGVVLNNDLWDIAEAVQGSDSRVMIETAGNVDHGVGVWILVRFDEPLVVKGDPNGGTLAYFALQNWHSKPGSLSGRAINTRIVCWNTWVAAEAEGRANGTDFTFKHGRNVRERIEEAKTIVGLWREQVTTWQHTMENLISVKVTDDQLREFVNYFHPMGRQAEYSQRVQNNVETARRQLTSILDGETCADVRNTAYGLAQAGIEWSQHYRRAKGGTASAKMEARFKRAVLSNDHISADSVALALEVAAS